MNIRFPAEWIGGMMITGGRVGSLEDGLDPGLNFEGIKKD